MSLGLTLEAGYLGRFATSVGDAGIQHALLFSFGNALVHALHLVEKLNFGVLFRDARVEDGAIGDLACRVAFVHVAHGLLVDGLDRARLVTTDHSRLRLLANSS